MTKSRRMDDFLKHYNDLSDGEKKEFMKRVMPDFCQTVMGDEKFRREMMP